MFIYTEPNHPLKKHYYLSELSIPKIRIISELENNEGLFKAIINDKLAKTILIPTHLALLSAPAPAMMALFLLAQAQLFLAS